MTTTATLDALAWPLSQLGNVVAALALRSGLRPRNVSPPAPAGSDLDGGVEPLSDWLEATADWLGIESESVSTTYAEVAGALEASAPAIWAVPGSHAGPARCIAIVSGGRAGLCLLRPDGGLERVGTDLVRRAVVAPFEADALPAIEAVLDSAGIVSNRRQRTCAALLHERHGPTPISGCWLLRSQAGSSFWRQAWRAGVPRFAVQMLSAHAAQYLLMLAGWWTLGRGALQGRFDLGWLIAWALLVVSSIPFRVLSAWSESIVSLRVGRLLKQRLLFGTFRLPPELVRNQGAGDLLGRVIESELVESLVTTGGFQALVALVEIGIVVWVLQQGPGGVLLVGLFAAWTALSLGTACRYYLRRRVWTDERLALTRDLVERMMGHRTQLAQQLPERWHDGEDLAIDQYLHAAAQVDRAAMTISALMGRGFIVVGLAGLVPTFLHGEITIEALALGIGAIMLADQTLQKLTNGVLALADAAIAWRTVRPLYAAAASAEFPGVPGVAVERPAAHDALLREAPILEARALTFRHPGRAEPIVHECDLSIHARDQILLEGPSGGGKSSLASVLSGSRAVDSGLLLLHGLDRRTLGATAWRRRVVSAPQFHENHIFTGSFAFNVLMGRAWPASPQALEEAEAICLELGLGPLLERMPGGLMQTVGESGWQLSHGERSRLYIARALVQNAELLVLDESFAALDPENLDRALRCVLRRANTLLVIAHP